MTDTIDTDRRTAVAADVDELLRDHPPAETEPVAFLGAQFDRGLAWVHFPSGRGGRGLAQALQADVDRALQAAGAPDAFLRNPIGHGMAAPTVVAHGSDELQERLLRPLFTGEEVWAQLFSEPGAGSDLAGLATRAEWDGRVWRASGQKVWTSLAQDARWALLVARTDPDVPKHKGLTYFVVDMHHRGVDVRPLRQLTGDAEFNEVYLDAVEIDDGWRLGEVGEGWRVAMTTLMSERKALGGRSSSRGDGTVGDALRLWAERPDLRSPAHEQDLLDLAIRAEAQRLTAWRHGAEQGDAPMGSRGAIDKVVGAELNQAVYDLCMRLLGPEATRYAHPSPDDPDTTPRADRSLTWKFLRSRANTIEGGTSEILRNIIGERLLGLPGDIRVDKDVPWRDVPRS
jgi:alkylation response protein AidB-like acyl-CoA dehydrogenase